MSVKIGTKFHYHYADGNCLWTVTKQRGRDTFECVIEDDLDYAGAIKVFGIEEIEASLQFDKSWSERHEQHVDWWEEQPLGRIIHYNNGFNNFVRGAIVVLGGGEKGLLPLALVGDWRGYDLPRRYPDGRVELGYYAKKIQEGDAWRPHSGCVFECPEYSYSTRSIDPTDLLPIDLGLPEPTPEELEVARLHTIIENAEAILGDYNQEPRNRLSGALAYLKFEQF